MKRGVGLRLALAILGLAGAIWGFGPGVIESRMNLTTRKPPYAVSARAAELHRRLVLVDLHADSLLWRRDLLGRASRGHVDVPRLIEAGVAIQAFTLVTKTPRGLNIESNDDRTDDILRLALVSAWPRRTWRSLAHRALYQAGRLRHMADRSEGRLALIRTSTDLDRYLSRRSENAAITAGFLGVEGAHALDGRLANLDRFYDAGIRMMSPSHFFDTDIGGSAHGVAKGGLTPLGREWVERMEGKRMIIDLAHASPATIDDVLAMATRPVVVSHTGVRGTCDSRRNLSDDQLRAIARGGGVVGIGFWSTATCGGDATAIARAIRHAIDVAGVDHVGLGSDFDGAVEAPFDVTGVPLITQALLDAGLAEGDIAKVMGGNAVRLLRATLP